MKSFTKLSMIVLTVAVGFAVLMPATAQGALVSYWPFTTDVSDVVGPNDGTVKGDAHVSGGESVLDGSGDYVDCGTDSSLEIGSMDDVAVWNEAIPASWIEGLADGTYTPLTVPEPASGILLGLASLLLAYAWRRRRSR